MMLRIITVVLGIAALSGCTESPVNLERVAIGKNPINGSVYQEVGGHGFRLIFGEEQVVLNRQGTITTGVPYRVEKKKVIVTLIGGDFTIDKHLEFILIDDEQGLVCTACAKERLSSKWVRTAVNPK